MKRIEATLPALGSYTVPFFKESEEVLNFLGEKELARLDRVQHLGISAKVFTGVNHSRLEYLLLQCAIINLLPKFHKGSEHFALGGEVRIPGQEERISSGQELLKCWAILGNCGHPQYTYGVERSLLNLARQSEEFRSIIFSSEISQPLRKWARGVVREYRDGDFHYLLAALRISTLPKRSRVRGRIYRILESFLLPLDELRLSEAADRYKLYRLRRLFEHVRLLCIVTLDAYYSHHPVRYQISGALMNLSALIEYPEEKSAFIELMENTAGWLADEIYLHPKSAAAQKHYEVRTAKRFISRYQQSTKSRAAFMEFMSNFMEAGFGMPTVNRYLTLARLSFPRWRFGSVFGRDEYEGARAIESQLADCKNTHVSILSNPYTGMVHIDLLYDVSSANSTHIASLFSRACPWFVRLVEAQVLWRTRRLGIPRDRLGAVRSRLLMGLVDDSYPVLRSIFHGLVKYILPDGISASISEYLPDAGASPLGFRFNYARGGQYDSLSGRLNTIVEKNPNRISEDRVHELKALLEYVTKSRAPFVGACLEKFILRDFDGNYVDDWDGVVIEIFEKRVKLTIIEAKNLRSTQVSENQAFKQLEKTRKLVRKRALKSSQRCRIAGYGAFLTFNF